MAARIGVGVIGAGKHGQRYVAHAVRDVPRLRVVALSRRDAAAGAAQARELGARFHADWRDLVADPDVAAVVSVVPPTLHLEIAGAVAAARKPLLIEKPLAPTGAQARDVARVLRDGGAPVVMAHTLRWNTAVQAIRERLATMGPLRTLVVNQRFEPSTLAWLDDPALCGGGIMLHTGVHSFDLVRHLTGREPIRVVCRTAKANTIRTEDNFAALMVLDGSDALVCVNGSRATLGRSGMIDAACEAGQIVGDHQQHVAVTVRGLERTPLPLPAPAMTVRAVLESLVALLDRGEPPPAALEDGVRSVQIVDACRASAAGGGWADVPPLGL